MREFMNIINESFDDPGYDQALALMKQYGTKPLPYSKLPPGAKKAVTHWMTVDGDNHDYKSEFRYSYAEIPTEVFMHNYLEGILRFDPNLKKSYVDAQAMIKKYQSTHPSQSKGFAGYDYAKHDLENPWPVIIGSEFFEDGAHRLGLYVYNKMSKIPAVMILGRNEKF